MKINKVTFGLLVASAVLSGIAVIVLCSVLVTDYFNRNNPPVDVSKESVTTKYTGNYWQSKLAELENEQAKTSTTKKTTTTLTTTTAATTAKKTTTTKNATTTTNKITSKTTDTTFKTTKATTTKTTSAIKTTRIATAAEKEEIYRSVLAEVMALYEDYKAVRLARIAEIDADISPLQSQASALYTKYMQDIRQLANRCEAMGMSTNSGYYKGQAEAIENQYKADLAPISKKIADLREEKEVIQSALAESESQLDIVIQAEYETAVEEFQKQTLS